MALKRTICVGSQMSGPRLMRVNMALTLNSYRLEMSCEGSSASRKPNLESEEPRFWVRDQRSNYRIN